MPRPKPANPLIGRTIKLTARQWVELDRRGGPEWLRGLLATPPMHQSRRVMLRYRQNYWPVCP